MLRILIISVGKMSGGIEKYTVTLGELLEKEGMKVYYVVRKGGWLENQLHEKNVLHVEMGKHIISDVKNRGDCHSPKSYMGKSVSDKGKSF